MPFQMPCVGAVLQEEKKPVRAGADQRSAEENVVRLEQQVPNEMSYDLNV